MRCEGASEVSISNIFIEQVKTAIRNIRRVSNRGPDLKQSINMFQKNLLSILMKMMLLAILPLL